MQSKQVSSANHSSLSSPSFARGARAALAAAAAALLLSPAWADIAQPLASVSALTTLTGTLPAWGRLPNSLVRVVYYRHASDGASAAAATRVYVNGRFHTALPAGDYTVFCLPAGLHTLASLDNPQASYNNSSNLSPAQMLLGGNTYVVQSGDALLGGNGHAESPSLIDAASRQGGRYSENRSRLLSRAQTVACPVQQAQAQP